MKYLKNSVIYELYVRNFSEQGDFNSVIPELDRIKSLGVDIIWFMPIHEISQEKKKGTLGCPYAIKDFKSVNHEYGTLEDFKNLIDEIHKRDMKVMIDIVFNHTGYNSTYYNNHIDYFYKNDKGEVGNKVGDWYDIIDLDYTNESLIKDQIDVLTYWSRIGIDGFRCDVAPLIPMEFWLIAREAVSKINPDTIWLAETVHPHFILELREKGFVAHSDCETYQAFDITYDYDVDLVFKDYLSGKISLQRYLDKLRQQEYTYPADYVKLRFLENHDVPRIASLVDNYEKLKMLTAFKYFEKGSMLLYNGQEYLDDHLPSLFDKDMIRLESSKDDYIPLLKDFYDLKQMDIMHQGHYKVHEHDEEVIHISYFKGSKELHGFFNVGLKDLKIPSHINDGVYNNLLTEEDVVIKDGYINLNNKPIIIKNY